MTNSIGGEHADLADLFFGKLIDHTVHFRPCKLIKSIKAKARGSVDDIAKINRPISHLVPCKSTEVFSNAQVRIAVLSNVRNGVAGRTGGVYDNVFSKGFL